MTAVPRLGLRTSRIALGSLLLSAALVVGAFSATARGADAPHIKHLFIIVMENENAEDTYSANPPAPYLAETMRAEGAYLPNYFGIGHQSLDNYLALISGQPPNMTTQSDCLLYTEMNATAYEPNGVALGQGCVYPEAVQTIANQLEDSGHTWRSYNQDMAAGATIGEPKSCRHPALGTYDQTQMANASNQYAARHDPFVYFHSITDHATCEQNVVDLTRLPEDLSSLSTSPEYAFITPDLCSDGHDATCADGHSPGGFAGINAFLEEWVPMIKASAAYRDHGALMVTFDESETGAESCCNEPIGPNTLNNGGPMPGNGGGRIGAVLESPCIDPGTVSELPYNHFSALRWMEDNWDLSHLGDASTENLNPIGADVFDNPACDTGLASKGAGGGGGGDPGRNPTGRGNGTAGQPSAKPATRLLVRPRHTVAGEPHRFRLRVTSATASCRVGATIAFAGHTVKTNRRGRARLEVTLSGPGRFVARARSSTCAPSRATVRAR